MPDPRPFSEDIRPELGMHAGFSEVVGTEEGKLRIAPEVFGFSPLTFTESREQVALPFVARTNLGWADLTMVSWPTRSASTNHPPQDAIGFCTRNGTLSVVVADGLSTVSTNRHPESEHFSHHLVASLAHNPPDGPLTSFEAMINWLSSIGPVPGHPVHPMFKTPTGASTLKLASFTRTSEGYHLHLGQLGNTTGALVGPTLVISPNSHLTRLPLSRDSKIIFYGTLNGTPDYQQASLPAGSVLAMGSDGLLTLDDFRSRLYRDPEYQLAQLLRDYQRGRLNNAQTLQMAIASMAKSNLDDRVLALIRLR